MGLALFFGLVYAAVGITIFSNVPKDSGWRYKSKVKVVYEE